MVNHLDYNQKILQNYRVDLSYSSEAAWSAKKIRNITFEPFPNQEIKRTYDIYNAYQINDINDSEFDLFIEPGPILEHSFVKLIKNIPDKNIYIGDSAEVVQILKNKFKIVINNQSLWIKNTDAVLDTDYQFISYVLYNPNKDLINIENNKITSVSNLKDASNIKSFRIKFKGILDKEKSSNIIQFILDSYPLINDKINQGNLIGQLIPNFHTNFINDNYLPNSRSYINFEYYHSLKHNNKIKI